MKKRLKKSQIKKPESFYIEVDPTAFHDMGLQIPVIKYKLVGQVEMSQVFQGEVLPLPAVLIHYLTHTELMIVTVVLEETLRHGVCNLTVKELSVRLKKTLPTISAALYSLRKSGIMLETGRGVRKCVSRQLNYPIIQHLYDLVQDEEPGIYARIRSATKKYKSIQNLTKERIRLAYDNKVLPAEHDPAEEEEYD